MKSRRTASASPGGIVFLGPAENCQGGIAAVLANYRITDFWKVSRSRLYPTSFEGGPVIARMLRQISGLAWFGPHLIFRRPAVVSVHTASRRSFYRNYWYMCLARALRIPLVMHVHPTYFGTFYRSGRSLRRWMIETAGAWSDQVVVLSALQKSDLGEVFPGKPIQVIPNPVDTSLFRPDSGAAPAADAPVVLYMGWIVQQKGVYDIVDAIPAVLERHPGARFVFAGNKEVEKLRRLIADRGLQAAAEVPGWVSGADKLALMRRSTVLLLPTYSEGIPNVILEAMAIGLPVVTTPVGGIPSVAEEGRTALFVEPGNSAELARRVIELLDDPALRRRLASEARATVEREFSIDRIGQLLASTYRKYEAA